MKTVTATAFGSAATEALRAHLAEVKASDMLAPVTVVTPSNYAGLSLRRALGAGGLVNVRFMVADRVAELLGAPTLARDGRRPLTALVRGAAVRAALREDPGFFAAVRDHVATEAALDGTFRELREANTESLERLARADGRGASVARLYRRFRALTADYYDQTDLAIAAAEAVRANGNALRDIGHVVLFLPKALPRATAAMVDAIAAAGSLHALIGLTGDAHADAEPHAIAAALGATIDTPDVEPLLTGARTHIVAVSDPEEEVRTVVRRVAEEMAAGVPLHRIGVFHRSQEPYARLLPEQLKASGIPHNGPATTSLADSVAGRTLLGAMGLHASSFRRGAVMDWLTGAPIRETEGGPPAPSRRWDALSRSAGITAGVDAWTIRLGHFAAMEERRAGSQERDGFPERATGMQANASLAGRLAAFVDELSSRATPPREQTHRAYAKWCRDLLQRYIGGRLRFDDGVDSGARDREAQAVDDVHAVLNELEHLDAALPAGAGPVGPEAFLHLLEHALGAKRSRLGPFGDGVFVGAITHAPGMAFDLVFVLGMVEGQMPPLGREDPLLPDDERRDLDSAVPLRLARRAAERRDYLALLAAGQRQVLMYPRAEMRGPSPNLPARWLLEAATTLASEQAGTPVRVVTAKFAGLEAAAARGAGAPWLTSRASFHAALKSAVEPANGQEYDLRGMVRASDPLRHFAATSQRQVRRGIAATRGRRSGRATEWDGIVAASSGRSPAGGRVASATGLETWAKCPFSYFMRTVLHVAETEAPEETLVINAADRGTLMHRALQLFFAGGDGFEAAPARVTRDEHWTGAERARLRAIGEACCAEAEQAGQTGKPLLWGIERKRILRELDRFLDAEEGHRARDGFAFNAAEFQFGYDNGAHPALVVTLGDGREVAFRGSIDRVEQSLDGGRIAVIDYKTGSSFQYKNLETNPLQDGQLLQLPIYGLAAADAFEAASVEASYWFITEKEKFERKGYAVSRANSGEFREALTTIVDGIGAGVFPANPGQRDDFRRSFEHCRFCAYDSICARDRDRQWKRKREAEAIEPYRLLAAEEPDDDD